MNKLLILCIFLLNLITFSCNNGQTHSHKKVLKVDDFTKSVKFYDKNGLLEKEGKFLYDTIKTGIWSYYEKGKLKDQIEFIFKDNSEYLNQIWVYDKNEELAGGLYYEISKIKDDYSLGEKILIEIGTPYKFFSDLDSELFLLYSSKEEFNVDYSNKNEIKFDTIWNIKKNYPTKFPDEDDYKFYIRFNIVPNKIGTFKAIGVLTEHASDFVENDSVTKYREIFLDIKFNVKDTIN